jgi:Ca2+-dependent lipid-binding protein
MPGNDEKPAGGYDPTPLEPSSGPTYTIKITFHSAWNLPASDYNGVSDPYVLAQLQTDLPTRHKEDPKLRYRSKTIRRSVEPEWEAVWVVAGIPKSGFTLSTRIYDEDPGNHDDRLGKVEIHSGRIDEKWKIDRETFKVKKTGADVMAYGLRWGKKLLCRDVKLHATLTMSIEVLGRTEEEVGKAYTLNNFWWVHWSPMIGRIAGTKTNDDRGVERFK